MARTEIRSIEELISLLGGPTKVAARLGVGVPAVSNWLQRKVPPEHFLLLSDAAEAKGRTLSPDLFRFNPGSEVRA